MVKLIPLPKETFTPLVAVIKARKCPAKEEKPGGKKQIIKKASIVLCQCKDHSIIYFKEP